MSDRIKPPRVNKDAAVKQQRLLIGAKYTNVIGRGTLRRAVGGPQRRRRETGEG